MFICIYLTHRRAWERQISNIKNRLLKTLECIAVKPKQSSVPRKILRLLHYLFTLGNGMSRFPSAFAALCLSPFNSLAWWCNCEPRSVCHVCSEAESDRNVLRLRFGNSHASSPRADETHSTPRSQVGRHPPAFQLHKKELLTSPTVWKIKHPCALL